MKSGPTLEKDDLTGTSSSTPALPSGPDPAGEPRPSAPPAHAAAALPPDGRSTRWADHRNQRRAELTRAARRAIHRGGPDISMAQIAAAAGTSKPILYRYFTDKAGLRAAVGQLVVEQMQVELMAAAKTAGTIHERLHTMVGTYLQMVDASPNVYFFITEPLDAEAASGMEHFMASITAVVARPFEHLMTASTSPATAQLWAAGAIGFVRGAGEWWLEHREEAGAPSRDQLTDQVTEWLGSGTAILTKEST